MSVAGFAAVVVRIGSLALSVWRGAATQWCGLALLASSLALFWWAVATVRNQPLDFAFSDRQPAQLVARGPYAYWRHPFYVSYSFGWFGAGLIAQSHWPFVAAALMCSLYLKAALSEERRFLESEMAGAYREYQSKAKLMVPWLV